MDNVVFINKKSSFIDKSAKIGSNCIIYPNNYVGENVVIEDNVTLLPGNYIINSVIGKGSKLHASVVENSVVGKSCIVGPYAHIRPKCKLGSLVRLGNYCELKNSEIGDNTKISHLAYVGDSVVGKNCNIGCGAIFVNYNGKTKAKISVGDGSFIGSNVNLIAPLVLAEKTYVCAGTTLTQSTMAEDFVIARPPVTIKPNYSKKYLDK